MTPVHEKYTRESEKSLITGEEKTRISKVDVCLSIDVRLLIKKKSIDVRLLSVLGKN
jgi:hypothetical protein